MKGQFRNLGNSFLHPIFENVRIKSSVFSFSYKSFSRILKKSWFPKGRRGSTDNPTPFYAFTKIAIRRSEIPPFCCSADVHLMRWLSFIYIRKRQRVSWTAKERDEGKKKLNKNQIWLDLTKKKIIGLLHENFFFLKNKNLKKTLLKKNKKPWLNSSEILASYK